MKKIYHLSTCSTTQAIIKETGITDKVFAMQDIKFEKITPAQLEEMKKMAGSYEALFSRRAIKYKALGLKDKKLEEKDYRKFILDEYTFLKRPVVIINDKIFVGNDKKTVAELKRLSGGVVNGE
jgi:arsenate reductase